MKRSRIFPLMLVALFAITIQWFDTAESSAEILPADELKSCQLHVIGIYSPKNHNEDDRVFVQVQPTDDPIVLVLSGYFGAQWNVEIADGADVRQIIVPGYFEHSVVGVSDEIPIEYITYFPNADKEKRDYFWAYSWHSSYGRKMRQRLKEITGLDITTFQGEYSGTRFVVDGKRGLASELDESRDLQPPPQQRIALANQLRDNGLKAKMQYQAVVQQYGKEHPIAKQLERSLELIQRELSRIGADPLPAVADKQPTKAAAKPGPDSDQRQVIEKLVRQSFELETQLQIARIEKAEADLNTVKQQLRERQASAEKIIRKRVAELLEQGSTTAKPAEGPASLLAQEGWMAWRKHDWRRALERFEAALAKEPDNESARNGLGWTLVHLREHDKAIEQFRDLLKDYPTHGGALNGLGQCLLMQGKLDEAEKELLKATEDAIDAHGEATVVRNGISASWFGLVRTYIAKKDRVRAEKWVKRYLEHKPDDQLMLGMLKELESIEKPAE